MTGKKCNDQENYELLFQQKIDKIFRGREENYFEEIWTILERRGDRNFLLSACTCDGQRMMMNGNDKIKIRI